MKSTILALSMLLTAPLSVCADQLIPAGSLIQCTVSEPKLSSKTTAIGDPVLCQISHAERYGRSVLPYDSYLVGRFEDYRDPGHFVGKGWMELKFERMVIGANTVLPVNARVVDVPGYVVDRQGRILGKGHAVRDTVLWMIPILWPIDLINLPRRGPRPTLKEETRVMLKVMDDLVVPETNAPDRDPSGLYRRPTASAEPPQPPQDDQPGPDMAQSAPQQQYAPPQQNYAPPQPQYYPAPQPVYVTPPPVYMAPQPVYVTPPMYVPAPPMYVYAPARVMAPPAWGYARTAVVVRNGYAYRVYVP
jgi:hypothetical protein